MIEVVDGQTWIRGLSLKCCLDSPIHRKYIKVMLIGQAWLEPYQAGPYDYMPSSRFAWKCFRAVVAQGADGLPDQRSGIILGRDEKVRFAKLCDGLKNTPLFMNEKFCWQIPLDTSFTWEICEKQGEDRSQLIVERDPGFCKPIANVWA